MEPFRGMYRANGFKLKMPLRLVNNDDGVGIEVTADGAAEHKRSLQRVMEWNPRLTAWRAARLRVIAAAITRALAPSTTPSPSPWSDSLSTPVERDQRYGGRPRAAR